MSACGEHRRSVLGLARGNWPTGARRSGLGDGSGRQQGAAAAARLPTSTLAADRPLVFVSYSKHDRRWLDDYLLRHLAALENEGLITAWTDHDIDLGGEWLPRIVQAMRDAQVAVCLISANYLATPFCVKEEIPYLLERQRRDGLELLLILLDAATGRPTAG